MKQLNRLTDFFPLQYRESAIDPLEREPFIFVFPRLLHAQSNYGKSRALYCIGGR